MFAQDFKGISIEELKKVQSTDIAKHINDKVKEVFGIEIRIEDEGCDLGFLLLFVYFAFFK